MKAIFHSLIISLLVGLTLVNASPIPQDVPDIAELCSALPADIASLIPECASAASPAPPAAQKRQKLPDLTVLCQQISKLATPLSAPCKQALPPPPPSDGRRRQLPAVPSVDTSAICKVLPAPLAAKVPGCQPAKSAPAARQLASPLSGLGGLISELGLPAAPAPPASPAAPAPRQLLGGLLGGEVTNPPVQDLPQPLGSLIGGILGEAPPAAPPAPAAPAPAARQLPPVPGLDVITGLLPGELTQLAPVSAPAPPAAPPAAARQLPAPLDGLVGGPLSGLTGLLGSSPKGAAKGGKA